MKILIGGPPYGCKNVGDEAILSSIVYSLRNIERETGKKLSITVLTDDKENTERILNIKTCPLHNRYKVGLEIIKTNLLICGGATILSDCPRYSLKLVKYAKMLKKKVIIYGVGMNSVENAELKKFIKENCNKADIITVRDKDVKKRLLEIGVNIPIFATADPAVLLKPADNKRIDEIMSFNNIPKDKIIIGIGVSGERDVKSETPIGEFAKTADYLVERFGAWILFIPTNLRKDQDVPLMEIIIDKMKNKGNAKILKDCELPEEIIGVVGRTKIVMSSRLHLLIFAVNAGIPIIGISRGEKVTSFVNRLGEEPVSTVSDFSLDKAKPFIGKIFSNYDEITLKVKNSHIQMCQQARRSEEILKNFIEGKTTYES